MSRIDPIVLADSVTKLTADAAGAVIVAASHGGRYAGILALLATPRGFILNDAGVGRDSAGRASLALGERHGVAAATVAHTSCRIGDVGDMWQRGEISAVNARAAAAGIRLGESCRGASALMTRLRAPARIALEHPVEARSILREDGWRHAIVLCDSASLVLPEDAGQIVVTASHGALVGGVNGAAFAANALFAVFNDAGGGADGRGTSRLPSLDQRRIAAVTVSAASARIGDGRSSYEDGVISVVNNSAKAHGARVGDRLRPLLEQLARG